MVRKSLLEREKKRRLIYERCHSKREELRVLMKKKSLSLEERVHFHQKLASLPKNASRVRQRNRCGITGRARGYYRIVGISRIKLRDLCSYGKISGLKKFSW